MIPPALLAVGFNLDWSISIGNLLSGVTFLVLALFAWRDLTWRVKNLEAWRAEHMVDADARDKLIQNTDKILQKLTYLVEGKERWEHNGVDRRRRPRT